MTHQNILLNNIDRCHHIIMIPAVKNRANIGHTNTIEVKKQYLARTLVIN